MNSDRLRIYAQRVAQNKKLFDSFELTHVPRSNPRIALVDELVNAALDREAAGR